VQGTGVPGLNQSHWFIWNNPGSFDGTATFRADRHINFGSGNPAYVYSSALVKASNNPSDQGSTYAFSAEMANYSNVSKNSHNVAVAGTAWKNPPSTWSFAVTAASGDGTTATITYSDPLNGTIPVGHYVLVSGVAPSGYNATAAQVTASSCSSGTCTVSYLNTTTGDMTTAGTMVDITVGATWAQYGICIDQTNIPDPISSCIGAEFDVSTWSATTDSHKQRVAVSVQAKGTSGAHAGRGILIGTDPGVTFDRGIDFTGTYGYGIDFSSGTFTGSAVYLGTGQFISAANDMILQAASGNNVRLRIGSATPWSISADGGALAPDSSSRNIGNVTTPVGSIYVATVNNSLGTLALTSGSGASLTLGIGGAVKWTVSGNTATLYPTGDSALNLGDIHNRIANVYANQYYAGANVQGVSCSAGTVNLSTLVVTNGIVTHC